MLVLEQRLKARHVERGIVLRARLLHGVQASGWRMKFALLRAEVEIESDPETYMILAGKLKAAHMHVKPLRRPTLHVSPKASMSPNVSGKPNLSQPALLASPNQMKPLYCQDGGDIKVNSPTCPSPGAILPDLPQAAEDPDKNQGLSKDASSADTQAWLARHRFNRHADTFANFSGADLLRMSRDDIIQICGLPDGIRLYNALHAKRIEPRLTVFVCAGAGAGAGAGGGGGPFTALYLHEARAPELLHKLRPLLHGAAKEYETVLVSGPNGARVRLTDDVVRHMPDNSTFRLESLEEHSALLLCATGCGQ